MSYRVSDGTRQWDGSKKAPEERMAMKMTSFARTGITPDIAGADLSYALKLQYNRWKAKDLAVDGGIVESDSYCCPSCGAISTVRELVNGCPYCKARFLMPDLFPKVTNFYFYEDDSSKVDFIRNTVIIGAVIAALYELVQCLGSRQLLDFVMVPVAGLMGAFIGLMCGVFLRDTYYVNNHIKIKDEEIRLQVARKRSARTDAGFSIKKVECKACGGSFDASHQRVCPYCHNAYDMKEQNWVITRIEK